MLIKRVNEINPVECPNGGFSSRRLLLANDNMGFTVTSTIIHPNRGPQLWHYKRHMEACLCVKGRGILRDIKGGKTYEIIPGVLYALNENDKHEFTALEETELVCVFNPPLEGTEVHGKDRSY